MIGQLPSDLTFFDKGLSIGVIFFFMALVAWATRRYFGKGGIADQRTASIEELGQTCHTCRDEQQRLHTRLAECIQLLREVTNGSG